MVTPTVTPARSRPLSVGGRGGDHMADGLGAGGVMDVPDEAQPTEPTQEPAHLVCQRGQDQY